MRLHLILSHNHCNTKKICFIILVNFKGLKKKELHLWCSGQNWPGIDFWLLYAFLKSCWLPFVLSLVIHGEENIFLALKKCCQPFHITNPRWPPDSPIYYNVSYLRLWKEYRRIFGVYSYVFMVRESIFALYHKHFCTFFCRIYFSTLFCPKNVSKIHNGTQTCRTGLTLSIKLMWQWDNGPCS